MLDQIEGMEDELKENYTGEILIKSVEPKNVKGIYISDNYLCTGNKDIYNRNDSAKFAIALTLFDNYKEMTGISLPIINIQSKKHYSKEEVEDALYESYQEGKLLDYFIIGFPELKEKVSTYTDTNLDKLATKEENLNLIQKIDTDYPRKK